METDEKFPPKLFVTSHPDGDEKVFNAEKKLEGEDGDIVAVYRLSYVRRLNVKKNLALRAVP